MADRVTHIYLGAASMTTALGDAGQTVRAIEARRSALAASEAWGIVAGTIDRSGDAARPIDGYTEFESMLIRRIGAVCAQSGLDPADPTLRLILSTTKGDIGLLAPDPDRIPPGAFLHESARRIAAYFGARTPIVISNACISGVSAFVVARRLILAGQCRRAIVAGCDLLSEFIVSGFVSFRSVSGAPCRPYDAARDGLSLGEACAAVVLTSDLGEAAQPAIELTGGAVTNDANHISGPSRTGDGLCYAMRRALDEAGCGADDLGFINLHGTATLYNDEMESKALAMAGLSDVPVNSLKGYLGHTLGAAGVVETILCAEQLRQGRMFATLGFERCGVPCPIDVSAQHRPIGPRRCVKTASGFGGCNAALVLADARCGDAPSTLPLVARAAVTTSYRLPQSELPFAEFIRREFHELGRPDMKFFKMSDLCKAAYVAVGRLLALRPAIATCDATQIAVVLSNASSSLEADAAHQRIVNCRLPEGASPSVFVYTLPNVAAGEVCIRHRIQGDNTFFIEADGCDTAERYARLLIERGLARVVICGRCEKLGEQWDVALQLLETANCQ